MVDHMSVDETPDILRDPKAESPPVFAAQDTSPMFDQQPMQNGPFVTCSRRRKPRERFRCMPTIACVRRRAPPSRKHSRRSRNVSHVAMKWATYVPESADGVRPVLAAASHAGYVCNDCQIASTRALTAGSIAIGRPHSRTVSPGHLFVASMPILLPSPATGEAKSR